MDQSIPARVMRFAARALHFAGRKLEGIGQPVPKRVRVRILERQGDWVVARIEDSVWRLDSTQYVDQQLLGNGVFEPESTEWVKEQVKRGMVVADVGANFGYYTVLLSRLAGDSGKVYAFEPSSGFRSRLKGHLQANHCENVVVSENALSDEPGTAELFTGDSTGSFLAFAGREPEEVQCMTFDEFVKRNNVSRLDFMKVDIDGHESKFVAGAAESLRRFQPTILIEFSHLHLLLSGSGSEELAKQLTGLGYVLYSEKTGRRFKDRTDFLISALNSTHSANVFCYPASRAP
jgi:FkbM family methyltransferase